MSREKVAPPTDIEAMDCVGDVKALLEKGSISGEGASPKASLRRSARTRDEARMTYTLPVLPGGKNEDMVPVLRIEQSGGRYWARTSDLCDVNAML